MSYRILFTARGLYSPIYVMRVYIRILIARNESSHRHFFLSAAFLMQNIYIDNRNQFQLNDGACVSPVAKVLGPGLESEKYIFAALVVPKSRFDPVSCTLLKASRNI